MKRFLVSVCFAGVASGAAAATVDFEGIVTTTTGYGSPPGLSVGGLTFNTVAGADDPLVRIIVSGDTRTDYVIACDGADFGKPVSPCEDTTLEVDFGGAIDSLSFNIVSDETSGASLFLTFVTATGSFDRSFTGWDANFASKDAASFTGLGGALSVRLTSNDLANVGFDDFHVVYSADDGGGGGGGGGGPGVVPLPGGLPLLAGALGAAALVVRRRPSA